MSLYTYRARVLRAVDGDTLELDVDYGFSLRQTHTIRLLASRSGFDAYELRDRDPVKRALAVQGWKRVAELAPVGSTVLIRTQQDRVDGFRRYLASVELPDGRDLGDTLLAEGLGGIWVRS